MAYLDFDKIKQDVSVQAAAERLDLKLKPDGAGKWRTACPRCKPNDNRIMVLTASRGFYCFSARTGGDQIALVAHVKDMAVKDAAAWLSGNETEPTKAAPGDCPVLDYLQPEDERVQKLGIEADTAKDWGSGFAPKGILRGYYAVPVRNHEGSLLAYIGLPVSKDQERLKAYSGFNLRTAIFGADRVQNGTLTLLRNPLDVLIAIQNGADNCVCFLTPDIIPAQLELLTQLMEAKECDKLELF